MKTNDATAREAGRVWCERCDEANGEEVVGASGWPSARAAEEHARMEHRRGDRMEILDVWVRDAAGVVRAFVVEVEYSPTYLAVAVVQR